MSTTMPVLGAAVRVENLERLRNWVFESQRDLELQEFCRADVLDGDWKPLAERYRALLDGYQGRLGVHGPFWGFVIDTMDPDVAAVIRKRFNQGLDACAAVGADQMVIHSPFTTWDYNNLDKDAGARSDMIERTHRNIGEIVKRAENQGVTLVIENIEDKDPADRVALARSFGSEAVKVSIDTGHAHYAHGSTGAPPVDYFVLAAGDMLHHVHIQDADGYADRHWAPGEGTIRWQAVFDALATVTSKPRLILELKDKDRIVAGQQWLGRLGVAA